MRIISLFIIVFGLLGLLTSCAQLNPHPMDMSHAIQKATTPADHEALAKHYEEAAKEMQAKMEEHRKMLEMYESNTSHYGRQALSLQSHCRSLISAYEQAERINMEMANTHRAMAAEIK